MDLVMEPGGRKTAHQLVRDTLRRAILTGQVPGGERLVQADIATQLNVSTTPVREALRDLATEGLIRLDAHRGAVVLKLNQRELEEIYRIRRVLEPEIMVRVVEFMTDEQLAEAEAIQRRADTETDPAAWVELNRDFHRAFIKAARSPRLAGIVETLQDSAAMYIVAALVHGDHQMGAANAQHWELIEAVRTRDVERAKATMLDHIHHTLDTVPELDE